MPGSEDISPYRTYISLSALFLVLMGLDPPIPNHDSPVLYQVDFESCTVVRGWQAGEGVSYEVEGESKRVSEIKIHPDQSVSAEWLWSR